MPEPSDSLEQLLPQWQTRIEQVLTRWLPSEARYQDAYHEAMRYASLNGGKRIRPALVYATGLATEQALDTLDGVACAVEMVHVYSLIHDDLPSMDDDALRRGKPTCHIQFGEAIAILAGDSLQALAFEVLSTDPAMQADPSTRLAMIRTLANASGYLGMAGGQAIDLAAVGHTLTLEQLERMHRFKTGALIHASIGMAALNAPGLAAEQKTRLQRYADAIGLAFQIRDDILDIEGDTETLGKQSGADQALEKPTFPGILGLAQSKQRLRALQQEALDALTPFGPAANALRGIADYIVERIH